MTECTTARCSGLVAMRALSVVLAVLAAAHVVLARSETLFETKYLNLQKFAKVGPVTPPRHLRKCSGTRLWLADRRPPTVVTHPPDRTQGVQRDLAEMVDIDLEVTVAIVLVSVLVGILIGRCLCGSKPVSAKHKSQ